MKILSLFFVTLFSLYSSDAEPNLQTGNKIENFTLTNTITNRPVSLTDFASEKGVVIVFTSNYCPYSKLYEDRIITLANQFNAQGIKFLMVNSNTSADNIDDTVEEMTRYAREKNWQIPYLADKEHTLSNRLGATKTPEAFVLQNTGNGAFIVKYKGAIDDNPQLPNAASAFYLRDAINAIVNKRNLAVVEKRATGCMIKKE
ncbi:thioredoxin family protein [Rhodocytophaga aerolata]|uniref:Thioredoxin family protein n=1 Tax=Rhodocytophaga aerolata TaxID=455078 RepID=A0ABT8R9R2_9BACT|nr:thioredoxin family protein [Rhodocytophaga aerolata]MDO1447430.1 thioredoxin family protein [Rhodocytophaga aerolata]